MDGRQGDPAGWFLVGWSVGRSDCGEAGRPSSCRLVWSERADKREGSRRAVGGFTGRLGSTGRHGCPDAGGGSSQSSGFRAATSPRPGRWRGAPAAARRGQNRPIETISAKAKGAARPKPERLSGPEPPSIACACPNQAGGRQPAAPASEDDLRAHVGFLEGVTDPASKRPRGAAGEFRVGEEQELWQVSPRTTWRATQMCLIPARPQPQPLQPPTPSPNASASPASAALPPSPFLLPAALLPPALVPCALYIRPPSTVFLHAIPLTLVFQPPPPTWPPPALPRCLPPKLQLVARCHSSWSQQPSLTDPDCWPRRPFEANHPILVAAEFEERFPAFAAGGSGVTVETFDTFKDDEGVLFEGAILRDRLSSSPFRVWLRHCSSPAELAAGAEGRILPSHGAGTRLARTRLCFEAEGRPQPSSLEEVFDMGIPGRALLPALLNGSEADPLSSTESLSESDGEFAGEAWASEVTTSPAPPPGASATAVAGVVSGVRIAAAERSPLAEERAALRELFWNGGAAAPVFPSAAKRARRASGGDAIDDEFWKETDDIQAGAARHDLLCAICQLAGASGRRRGHSQSAAAIVSLPVWSTGADCGN